jgi:uncharacterized protein YuzE
MKTDEGVDAFYIRLQEKEVARTKEISDGVNLDFDTEGRLIGLEFLSASKRYSSSDILNLYTENLTLSGGVDTMNVICAAFRECLEVKACPLAICPALLNRLVRVYSILGLSLNQAFDAPTTTLQALGSFGCNYRTPKWRLNKLNQS